MPIPELGSEYLIGAMKMLLARSYGLGAQTSSLVRVPSVAASTAARCLSTASAPSETEKSKPYAAIPGPLKLPVLGTLWDLILFPWNWRKPTRILQLKRMKKYGVIYRENLPVLGEIIVVHDPIDVQRFSGAEGRYPTRIPLSMWIHAKKELKMEMGVLLS